MTANWPLWDELPPPLRLAVTYAPRRARLAWAALLVLDRRLARVALAAGEPVLGQIRLAWWRDRFAEPASAWPSGEPLLAALHGWDGDRAALVALDRQMGGQGADAVAEMARRWASADLAARLGDEPMNETVSPIRLPRAMRPLIVLDGLARSGSTSAWRTLGRTIRLGMLGR